MSTTTTTTAPIAKKNRSLSDRAFGFLSSIVENIYLETFNSILVIGVFTLYSLYPDEMAGLYKNSSEYKVGWSVLFLWVVGIRAARLFISYQRVKHKTNSWTFLRATRLYSRALKVTEKSITEHGITYRHRDATAADKTIISELAHQAWDLDENNNVTWPFADRQNYISTLMAANPDIFSLLFSGDKPIGYVSVIPMKSTDHFAGQLSQYDFTSAHIIPQGKSELVYLQAIFIETQHRDKAAPYKLIVKALIEKTKKFAIGTDTILYAEQFTGDGKYLLRKMGFQRLSRRSKTGRRKGSILWELPLDANNIHPHYRQRKNAEMTIEAIVG